jgi:hypothetical protein
MPLGAAELSPQLRASWLGGRALGDGGAAQLNPAPQYATDGQSSMCFGHHQKYESDATLFACYDAVTPLRERFCQNAFARRGDGSRSGACHLGVQLGGSARLLHCPRQLPASLDRGQWDGGSLRMHWRCRVSAFRATLRLKDRSLPCATNTLLNLCQGRRFAQAALELCGALEQRRDLGTCPTFMSLTAELVAYRT